MISKSERKKSATKILEKEVKLDLKEITCQKSVEELAKFELTNLMNRLTFIVKEHGIRPVLKDINIQFEKIENGD